MTNEEQRQTLGFRLRALVFFYEIYIAGKDVLAFNLHGCGTQTLTHKSWLRYLEQSMCGGGAEKSHPHEVYTTMKAKKKNQP